MYFPWREEALLWGGMEHGFFSSVPLYPTLAVLVAVQLGSRVSNFGFSRPVREILFTTVPLEDRYKAKNFIDKVIYHVIDQRGSWTYAGLIGIGLGITAVSVVAVPL